MEWTDYLSIGIFQAVITVLTWYVASYTKEKGKNLATREDIQDITTKIEEVKADFAKTLKASEMLGYSELEYRKQQLKEFYGPIYAYLKSNEILYDQWTAHKISEINSEVKQVLRKQNESIVSILINNAHLIDGDSFPDHFQIFAAWTTIWNLYCSRPGSGHIPENVRTALLPNVKWPDEFQAYFYEKTEELKKRLNELHEKYQVS